MSKEAETPAPGTGVGQKAEPTSQFVAGVSSRFGGDAVVLSAALPFSCHPPDTGDGIAVVAAAALGELATAPMPSDTVAVIRTAPSRRRYRDASRLHLAFTRLLRRAVATRIEGMALPPYCRSRCQ
jgi:hypothetical protein